MRYQYNPETIVPDLPWDFDGSEHRAQFYATNEHTGLRSQEFSYYVRSPTPPRGFGIWRESEFSGRTGIQSSFEKHGFGIVGETLIPAAIDIDSISKQLQGQAQVQQAPKLPPVSNVSHLLGGGLSTIQEQHVAAELVPRPVSNPSPA